MQSNLETLGRLERRLTMAVPTEAIEREVEQRLKKLSRSVRLHGFRPGKVPLKIVARQYGPQVRSEVIGDEVQKIFDATVKENNLRVAGYPRIERSKESGDDKHIAFSATFEVYPEVVLGDVSSAKIERFALEVGGAEIDKTIEIMRKQRVTYDAAERAAQTGDRVTLDFTGTIDGAEFPGNKGSEVALVLGENRMLPDFESNIAGLSASQTRTFPLKYPEDYGVKEIVGRTAVFDIAMRKVEAPRLPEVDAEFAKSLGVADGDLGKMREEVKANVEREVKKRVEADLKQKVMQALLDTTKLDLPKSLVELETQRLVQSARADLESRGIRMEQLPINPEVFEAQAQRRVALGIVVGELVRAHNLAAMPAQVRALVDEYAQTYEQPTEVVKWIYSQPERLREFEGLALEANVIKWVLENVKVEDKVVTFDELMGKAA
ncbi:MAG: trigger factor [Betaproteobacteria bacterium RIFCSPLOWO2_02_FULL_64_12]|nr:MAG: trigger factor [Betaproteobacteria bacterium RIFCSPLOWO2_02_FULL_64_12]